MNCYCAKRTLVSRALASVLVLGLPAAALAQPANVDAGSNHGAGNAATQQNLARPQFRRLDANHDGYISREEFDAYRNRIASQSPAAATRSGAPQGTLAHNLYASDLIGMDVRNAAGRDSGEIEDLVVDVDSGKVRSAVVSFGGFAGIGDKVYRYPLSAFSAGPSSDQLVLNVSDDAIRGAHGYDRSNWNFNALGDNGDRRIASNGSTLWQASNLIGRDVADRNDDHLGEIKDLAIDGQSGAIRYVVMRYDRPWSLDNPLVAVPLHALRFAGDHQTVSMNVDRNEIDTQRMAGGGNPSRDLWIERWYVLVPQTTTQNARGTTSQRDAARAATMSGAGPSQGSTSATGPGVSAGASTGNLSATGDTSAVGPSSGAGAAGASGLEANRDGTANPAGHDAAGISSSPASTNPGSHSGAERNGVDGSRAENTTP